MRCFPSPMTWWDGLPSIPGLKTSGRKAVTVGGVRGTQIDISIEAPYPACLGPCVQFFATAPGCPRSGDGLAEDQGHSLEVDGQRFLIGILASEEGFAELVPVAEQVVETIEFP